MTTDEQRIVLVETSFLKIRKNKDTFAQTFYENLFVSSPELKPLFQQTDMKKQNEKLYGSLVLLVENLRDPETLASVLVPLGEKHKGYGAIKEHYPLVGGALIEALKTYIGKDWTPAVEQAWGTTYGAVVEMMLKGNVNEELETPEENVEFKEPEKVVPVNKKRVQRNRKLTYIQKAKLKGRKNIFTKINKWFWRTPKWMIALYAAIFFFLFSFIGQSVEQIQIIIDTLEPLSIFIAVLLFIKEIPERKRQFHYQAWSIIDSATGIENSHARMIALEDLCDDGVSLAELELSKAKLNGIELNGVDLSNANLNQAKMVNAEMFYTKMNNVSMQEVDCNGATFYGSNLGFAQLQKSNCSSVNFSKANLMFANLEGGNFSGANFSKANLKGASFEGAYLSGANLEGAEVIMDDLEKAYLVHAIMPNGQRHE